MVVQVLPNPGNLFLDDWYPTVDEIDLAVKQASETHYEERAKELAAKLLPSDYVSKTDVYYSLISAAKGDDYGCFTDNSEWGLAYLYAMEFQDLKISWKDVNFSNTSLNYGESMILLPPNRTSHWEYVLRRSKDEGIPYILDPVKLKELTPVRKQSNKETDLPSKMKSLSIRAGWCNPSWPSYWTHQHALLIGLAVFDFESSHQFPFLMEREGGCGGPGPYRNPDTIRSAVFHHRRGAESLAIYGVMREATAVNSCQLSPERSIFLRWVHQAQTGDPVWIQSVGTYLEAKSMGITDDEILGLVKGQGAEDFPSELEKDLIRIDVKNPLIGSTISHMRKLGIIYTKMDVQDMALNARRQKALYGDKPMETVLEEIEEAKRAMRTSSLRILREILGTATGKAKAILQSIPTDREGQNRIITNYLRDLSSNSFLSSMCYQEKIEVIHAKTVESWKGRSGKLLLADSLGVTTEECYSERYQASLFKIPDMDAAEKWLSDLKSGHYTMPPAGIGTRDSHILLMIESLMKRYERLRLFLVTSDRNLITAARKWVRYCSEDPGTICRNPSIAQISAEALFTQSILADSTVVRGVKLTDPKTLKTFYMQEKLSEALDFRTKLSWRRGDDLYTAVIYDEPNIVRRLAKYSYDEDRKVVRERSGGYLTPRLALNLRDWQKWSLDSIKSESCLQESTLFQGRFIDYWSFQGSVVSSETSSFTNVWDQATST